MASIAAEEVRDYYDLNTKQWFARPSCRVGRGRHQLHVLDLGCGIGNSLIRRRLTGYGVKRKPWCRAWSRAATPVLSPFGERKAQDQIPSPPPAVASAGRHRHELLAVDHVDSGR